MATCFFPLRRRGLFVVGLFVFFFLLLFFPPFFSLWCGWLAVWWWYNGLVFLSWMIAFALGGVFWFFGFCFERGGEGRGGKSCLMVCLVGVGLAVV